MPTPLTLIGDVFGGRENEVVRELAAESERDKKRLAGFVRICQSTIWTTCPEATTQKMQDALVAALECDLPRIHLLAVSGDYLSPCASDDPLLRRLQVGHPLPITAGRMPWMMETHQPIVMDDFAHPHPDDQIDSITTVEAGFRSGVSVPLLAGDEMLGMYTVLYKRYQRWTEGDIDYLLDIGRLLGTSIQHAQITRKAIDLAVLMERKRLSGEIHDNLSQLVSSLSMSAEAALLSYEDGDAEGLRSDLERINCTAQEAVHASREEMLALRTTVDPTDGLIPALRDCLGRFRQQWRVETALEVKNIEERLVVPAQTVLQFSRILHECLSNVLRHAQASQVTVILEVCHNRLHMQIEDNGRGFDPRGVSSDRLGLRIMRERAESLGGELTILSGKETGTKVRVDVPLYA